MPTRAEVMQALRAADAAGAEDDARRLAAMYKSMPPDASETAAPAPAPAPPPGGGNAGAYSTATGVPNVVNDYVAELAAKERNNPTSGMNLPERIAAGSGKALVGMGRGVKQIGAYLTGDKDWQQQLEAEEAEARRLDEPLMDTAGGKVGYYGTELASYALPASKIAKIPAVVRGGRAALAAAEAGMGGIQGAIRPTVEGESRGTNATIGAGLGVLGTYAKPILSAGNRALAHVPLLGAPSNRLLVASEARAAQKAAQEAKAAAQARSLANQEANRVARTTAQQAKAAEKAANIAAKEQAAEVRNRAGTIIEKYVGKNTGSVALNPSQVKSLRDLSKHYGENLPEFFHKGVKGIDVAGATPRVTLQRLQQMKSALGGHARELGRQGKNAVPVHEAERQVLDVILKSMPARKANLLRKAYGEYGSGIATAPRRGVKTPAAPAAPVPAAPASASRMAQAIERAGKIPGNINSQYLEGLPEASKRQLVKSGLFPWLDSEVEE